MSLKISSKKKPDGFYEMFSDLIFGMMAIFVLLFVILITLVKPPPPDNKPPSSIDLVIAIDVSGSMGEQIKQLKTALRELGKNLPNLIDDFRIGVIAFRYGEFPNGDEHFVSFDIREMTDENYNKLIGFLDENVEKKPIVVNPAYAIEKAIDMFAESKGFSERTKVFALIGDAPPEYPEDRKVKNNNKASWDKAKNIIGSFSTESEFNRFLSLYSGTNDTDPDGKGREFFCNIAKTADEQGRFADGSELLIWELLEELWSSSTVSKRKAEAVVC